MSFREPYPELDGSQAKELNRLMEQFSIARVENPNIVIDEFVPEIGSPIRVPALHALIVMDVERRWAQGRPAFLEDYLDAYPELGKSDDLPTNLIAKELKIRQQYGDDAPLSEYRKRFPNQIQELENVTENAPMTKFEAEPPHTPVTNVGSGEMLSAGPNGNYQLLQRLGHGNFGEVWRAKKAHGGIVAVKIISWSTDHPAAQRELTSLKVILGKELRHPYLLSINEFHEVEKQLVIEMELAEGSLRDRLNQVRREGRKGIEAKELLHYMREAAETLDYLHSKNVQHRDIKPDNLLLCNKHIKVADLGLAKLIEMQQDEAASILGTPAYMAPETWRSTIDTNSDQYSLAVTYLELRRGGRPKNAYTDGLLAEHMEDDPKLEPLLPEERRVLLKAGARDPKDRYDTCMDFVEALEESLKEEPVPTRPFPTTSYIVAASIIALVGLGLFLLYRTFWGTSTLEKVEVRIASNPPGATVSLTDENQSIVAGEGNVFHVKPGKYTVRLEKADYEDLTKEIVVTAQSKQEFTFPLTIAKTTPGKPIPRKVIVRTDPPNAVAEVVGRPDLVMAQGGFELSPGNYQLVIKSDDYKTKKVDLKVPEGKGPFTSELFVLDKLFQIIRVDSNPPFADVYIDDDMKQQFPAGSDFKLPLGKHKITVKKKFYKPITYPVNVSSSVAPASIFAKLEELPKRHFAFLVGVHQPSPQLPDYLHAEADVVELGQTFFVSGYDKVIAWTQNHGQIIMRSAPDGGDSITWKEKAIEFPTAQAVGKELDAMLAGCTEADSIVVALVGHQTQVNGDEQTSYFCPDKSDLNDKGTLISINELIEKLKTSPLFGKVLMQDGWRRSIHEPLQGKRIPSVRPLLPTIPEVAVMSCCRSDEMGYDHREERHGVFMYYAINGLRGGADKNEDGAVSLGELDEYLQKEVPAYTTSAFGVAQNPVLQGALPPPAETLVSLNDSLLNVYEASRILNADDKNLGKANTLLTAAAAEAPKFAAPHLGLAAVNYFAAKSATQKDDKNKYYQDAAAHCNRCLQIIPKNPTAYSYLGEIHLAKSEYNEAIADLNTAYELEPMYARTHNLLGKCYGHLVKEQKSSADYEKDEAYRKAVEHFKKAVQLDDKFVAPLENRAFLLFRIKRYDEAILDLENATKIDDKDKGLFLGKGMAYMARGLERKAKKDYDNARKDFEKAAKSFQSMRILDKDDEKAELLLKRAQMEIDECKKLLAP